MYRLQVVATIVVISLVCVAPVAAQENSDDLADHGFKGLELRPIGPAITSGRISDFAFHPDRKHEFFAATASGNLWKTENNGITWTALFENEGSYAIGVVTLDPDDPNTVWVGTGENNAQRSVAFGDGVYKSTDGGKSWSNMGLRESGHISQIWIDPGDSNTVLVAAQGPLWSPGGDRGLYKSTDGGATWNAILTVDENTGINEFVVDPRDSNNIVASSYQRRRHVWVLINGGPGSAIHKSTDGGITWREVTSGLPSDHMGRIGLAGAPTEPDMIYAIIEANDPEEQGIYRSTDFGASWHKRSDHMTTSGQYYNELVVDPQNPDRLYVPDTFTHISEDGGKTWSRLGLDWRHVDDHALWIDPDNTAHIIIGGDGGIYESYDRGDTWRHVRNLSIAQFYRIQPDNAEPFYNVCGGTQDNNSLCAPSRTTVIHGITNSDWTIILGGDGYKPQFDPDDPNIIYTQYQYGGLARYDRRTQERVFIAPHPAAGEQQYKWNWSTPLLVSPHNGQRIFYAAEKLFQSDDRGNNWRTISPDLTRQLDRNELDVMGRVWSVDTVAKNDATSMYGSAIGLSESPLLEGLIYVGTDDGVISVTQDGGESWDRVDKFRGVPDMSLVEDIVASVHDVDVAYAVIDNHKRGDHKPYVLRSDNRGESWALISGNLPVRGSAHTIAEDHVDPNLLFVGTEFGLFFTQDRGENWHQLRGKFPTISVRDLEIQRRETDLVVGTFGRGIYILDDYSPLRTNVAALAETPATLFEVKDPWLYVEGDLWDGREKGSMGAEFFSAPNPPFGAIFTYHLRDGLETQAKARRKAEIEAEKEGKDTPYPTWDALRAEDREEDPAIIFVVKDASGNVVRQLSGETETGLHRSAWDLRHPAPDPVSLEKPDFIPYWATPPRGPLVVPGEYSVTLAARRQGRLTELDGPESFTVRSLAQSPETSNDPEAVRAFQRKAGGLHRAVQGAIKHVAELENRVAHVKTGIADTAGATEADAQAARDLSAQLADINVVLNGDSTVSSRNEAVPWSVSRRAGTVYRWLLETRSPVPDFYEDSYRIAADEFAAVLPRINAVRGDLEALESRLESLGGPWTPGRPPSWDER
ncbi:MAG: glycosyl hydrolase [Gammaproteobacteria bacterium]|nr:glycosyl hydrolase [Gammaproteobacteria bacterium]